MLTLPGKLPHRRTLPPARSLEVLRSFTAAVPQLFPPPFPDTRSPWLVSREDSKNLSKLLLLTFGRTSQQIESYKERSVRFRPDFFSPQPLPPQAYLDPNAVPTKLISSISSLVDNGNQRNTAQS